MTYSDFFLQLTLDLARENFKNYPEYGTGHEPFRPFNNDAEKESFDPYDEANPSRQIAWVRRILWCAEDLSKAIAREYPEIFDIEYSI